MIAAGLALRASDISFNTCRMAVPAVITSSMIAIRPDNVEHLQVDSPLAVIFGFFPVVAVRQDRDQIRISQGYGRGRDQAVFPCMPDQTTYRIQRRDSISVLSIKLT